MKQNIWLLKWILLCGAGLLLARNQFFGLSPFVSAYATLLFYFAGEKRLREGGFEDKQGGFIFGSHGGLLLCSIIIGIVMEFSVFTGIRYGITILLCGLIVTVPVKKGKRMSATNIALCAAAGEMGGILSAWLLWGFSGPFGIKNLILCVLEMVLSFFLVYVFYGALRFLLAAPEKAGEGTESGVIYRAKAVQPLRFEELLSVMLLASFVLMGCPGLVFNGFDFIFALRFFFILFTAYIYGAGAGAVSGALTGFLLSDISSDNILLLCLCGVVAGIGREFSKLMAVLGFLVMGMAFYCLGNTEVVTPYRLLELGLAAVAFLIIPARYLSPDFEMETLGLRNGIGKREQSYRECFQGIIKDRMKDYSVAFSRLTRGFRGISEERQEMGFPDAVAMIGGISEKICGQCTYMKDCVTRTERENLKASAGILRAAVLEGEMYEGYLPKEFLDGCIHADEYIYCMDKEILLARMNLKWHNGMAKTREAIASQMKEISVIMDRLSRETMGFEEIYLFDVDRLRLLLKRQYIELGQVVCLKTGDGRREIHLFARAKKGCVLTTKELVDFVSRRCRIPLKPFGSTKQVIDEKFEKISLREDTRFGIHMGIARCTKLGETVSGDSFSCMNLESGKAMLSISDGMGSGEKAFRESQAIMDLTEEMMEAGFGHETTIRLINSVLMEQPEKQSFSTLDLCVIDLYRGNLDMMKIGGAPAFIKRGNKVETLECGTLPMGILDQMELASVKRKLYDRDMVIMISDGVLDGIGRMFPGENPVEALEREISELCTENPKEVARHILKASGGDIEARDDMTILSAYFYEKRKE